MGHSGDDGGMSTSDRRTEALRGLPEVYALALRLRDAGTPADEIADRLGVEPEAVGPLLAVAEGKLEAILARENGEP
jgi:DNA-directed RNA polymerase specialized sigma24 family protein